MYAYNIRKDRVKQNYQNDKKLNTCCNDINKPVMIKYLLNIHADVFCTDLFANIFSMSFTNVICLIIERPQDYYF